MPRIVVAHGEKEHAAATFKRTFGYHPLGVWCDNTQEFLTATLRAGNAGSNTACDHVQVLTEAIGQVPASHRKKLLIRSDGAGASHQLADWLHEQDQVRGRTLDYSIGFAITEGVRAAIKLVPEKVWSPALDADGGMYQRMIAAYRPPDRTAGRVEMSSVIDALTTGVPKALAELGKLGRTLAKRVRDVLACFDRPCTSNGPIEAVNGRLEHPRGLALGFRNLTNYITGALIEADHDYTLDCEESVAGASTHPVNRQFDTLGRWNPRTRPR